MADQTAVYAAVKPELEEFGRVLRDLIERLLAATRIRPHSITYRVKGYQSATRKLASKPKQYGGVNELADLLGLRVITHFADDVDLVADVITAEFSVDEDNSIDKRLALAPDRFGYASLHYVLTLSDNRSTLSEHRRFAGRRFELQIRSILQHAWAEIEHDLGYKSERAVPNEVRRRFSRLAGMLELADDEFVAVRDSLETYASEVKSSTKERLWQLEINQSTLLVYLQSAEIVRQLDGYIARQLGVEGLHILPASGIADEIDQLAAFNIHYVEQLDEELEAHKSEIATLAKHWIAIPDPDDLVHSDDATLPRGVCLNYLWYFKLVTMGTREHRVAALNKLWPHEGSAMNRRLETVWSRIRQQGRYVDLP